jgi:MoxR-like ATPase
MFTGSPPSPMFDSVEETSVVLADHAYIADIGLSTSLYLALKMGKALFLEGEPGVGKTELAKVLSSAFSTDLIRLQCFEGLDLSQAVYEWNYPRQLLEIQARAGGEPDRGHVTPDIFTEEFLLKRPLLKAIDRSQDRAPVLLIDELDRADEEFESFLLELLSDFQVTVPEIGTLTARHRPVTIITSNRTREIHDALKRRCVYYWIDYPDLEKELEIVRRKVPGLSSRLSEQVVAFVQALREEDLYKHPGVAETLDWAEALGHLEAEALDGEIVERTLGILLKYQDDVDRLRGPAVEALLVRATP